MHSTKKYFDVGLKAVKEAEKIILKYFNAGVSHKLKKDRSPVTVADQQAEEAIHRVIKENFPDHGFLGEESGATKSNADYIWVVDPIDGTRYFTKKMPYFSTELALLYKGKVILGISNAPLLKSTLSAIKGKGAFENNKHKLKVSTIIKLDQVVASASSIKYFDDLGQLSNLAKLNRNISQLRGIEEARMYRDTSSGVYDAIIFAKGYAWDFAAISLIATEAGAKVTDLKGKKLDLLSINPMSLLIANPTLHKKILEFFK
jgi:histidinol-phosphatase